MDLTKKKAVPGEGTLQYEKDDRIKLLFNQAESVMFDSIYFIMHLPDEIIFDYRAKVDRLLFEIRREKYAITNLNFETAAHSPDHSEGLISQTHDSQHYFPLWAENIVPEYFPVPPAKLSQSILHYSSVSPVVPSNNIAPCYSRASSAEPDSPMQDQIPCVTTTSHPILGQSSESSSCLPFFMFPGSNTYLTLPTSPIVPWSNWDKTYSAPKSITDLGLNPNFHPYFMHRVPQTYPISTELNSIQESIYLNRQNRTPIMPPYSMPNRYTPYNRPNSTSTNIGSHVRSFPRSPNHDSVSHTRFSNEPLLQFSDSDQYMPNVGTIPTSFSPNTRPHPNSTENDSILNYQEPSYLNRQTLPPLQTSQCLTNDGTLSTTSNVSSYRSPKELNSITSFQKPGYSNLQQLAPSGLRHGTSHVGTISTSSQVTSESNSDRTHFTTSTIEPRPSPNDLFLHLESRQDRRRVRTTSTASTVVPWSSPNENKKKICSPSESTQNISRVTTSIVRPWSNSMNVIQDNPTKN